MYNKFLLANHPAPFTTSLCCMFIYSNFIVMKILLTGKSNAFTKFK